MHSAHPITQSLALLALSAALAVPGAGADEWTHQAGITAFAFGMEGHAGVRGISAEADFGIKDVLGDLEGAFTAIAMGDNGRWGYWGSYEYMKLGDDAERVLFPDNSDRNAVISAKADFATHILDAGLSWHVPGVEWLEVLAGVRAWRLDQEFRVAIDGALVQRRISRNVSESWVDGTIGLRAKFPISERWYFSLRGDAGYGESDASWQALAMFNYQMNDCWTTSAGVRYLAEDYENDGFVFDMEMTGFEVAALYRF